MAERLTNDELVSFKELLMSNEIYMEAIVQVLFDKGVWSAGLANFASRINLSAVAGTPLLGMI